MNNVTQEQVYAQVGEKMKSQFLDGHAVVMFAYGLSGSGKTFSVFGPDMVGLPEAWFNFAQPHRFWGVFPRLAYDIMTCEAPKRGGEWKMSIKYFQNVVDRIWDLLSGDDDDDDTAAKEKKSDDDNGSPSSSASPHFHRTSSSLRFHPVHEKKQHKLNKNGVEDRHINDGFHVDSHGFVDITWCRKKRIVSWTELIHTFKTANAKKAIAPTQYNRASTRGHCILVFEADMPHPTKVTFRVHPTTPVCFFLF